MRRYVAVRARLHGEEDAILLSIDTEHLENISSAHWRTSPAFASSAFMITPFSMSDNNGALDF